MEASRGWNFQFASILPGRYVFRLDKKLPEWFCRVCGVMELK